MVVVQSKKTPQSRHPEEIPAEDDKPIHKTQLDVEKQTPISVQLRQTSEFTSEEISKDEIKLKTTSEKTFRVKDSDEKPLDVSQASVELEQEESKSLSVSVTSIELKPQPNKVVEAHITSKEISVPDTAVEPEDTPIEIQMTSTIKRDKKKDSYSLERVEHTSDLTDSEGEKSPKPITEVDKTITAMKTSTLERVESTVEEVVVNEDQPENQQLENTVVIKTKQRILKKATLGAISRYIAPSFKKKLQPLTSRSGKKIRLNCLFEGEPIPTITWYCNEILIKPDEHWAITILDDSSILEISNVALEDSGIYTCRAVNEAGSASTSANVIVTGTRIVFTLPLLKSVAIRC